MYNDTKKDFVLQGLKGVGIAYISTLAGILIFALILKTASASSVLVKVVNQFIKALSVFLGCFFSFRGQKGWLKGILTGLIYTAIVYLTFALLGGGEIIKGSVWLDLVFTAAIGAISGVLAVNVRKQ